MNPYYADTMFKDFLRSSYQEFLIASLEPTPPSFPAVRFPKDSMNPLEAVVRFPESSAGFPDVRFPEDSAPDSPEAAMDSHTAAVDFPEAAADSHMISLERDIPPILGEKRERDEIWIPKKKRICTHGIHEIKCRFCTKTINCEHDRLIYTCIICTPQLLCEAHGKTKVTCVKCNPSLVCDHGFKKRTCSICHPYFICEHMIRKTGCPKCNPHRSCIHGKIRLTCSICKRRAAKLS